MLPWHLHRRYMVFSGQVRRPKRVHFTAKQVFMRQKNAATEMIIYSKSSECTLLEGMITSSWKILLPDLYFFKEQTHIILGDGGVPCPSLVLQVSFNYDAHWHDAQRHWAQIVQLWIIACYTRLPTIRFMSELTLKNSEVNLISEKTRESACAILPSKTLPNQFACTMMEHHHKMNSRRVPCCLLSSTSFLV